MEVIEAPPRRILVVTPHPDDAEGGCGGTMGKWAKEAGTQVVVVLCTNGNAGTSNREMSPQELALTREREQQEASDVLGVKEVVLLSHPTAAWKTNRCSEARSSGRFAATSRKQSFASTLTAVKAIPTGTTG